ncbi:hypothetical protein AtubIFM54640_011545 [Aspergillus tubingensis]|nr:hypothetical protein AtubIFM54640_011545 [Aspergillus tubingensis]
MVGLDELKERVRQLHRHAKMNAQRKSVGQPIQIISLNGILMGPSGTGKTTFATLYGRILSDLGLLPRGGTSALMKKVKYVLIYGNDLVIRKTGSGLIGKGIGETEERVRNAGHEAEGNVLIIDDAYALWGEGKNLNSLHKAAIDTLVKVILPKTLFVDSSADPTILTAEDFSKDWNRVLDVEEK